MSSKQQHRVQTQSGVRSPCALLCVFNSLGGLGLHGVIPEGRFSESRPALIHPNPNLTLLHLTLRNASRSLRIRVEMLHLLAEYVGSVWLWSVRIFFSLVTASWCKYHVCYTFVVWSRPPLQVPHAGWTTACMQRGSTRSNHYQYKVTFPHTRGDGAARSDSSWILSDSWIQQG